jgi:threonine dehydratase
VEREKLVAEPAGAAGLAVALEGMLPQRSTKVGVLISGGNVDPNLLDKCIQTGLASAGRFLAFQTYLMDRPGELHRLTGLLAQERVNILHVQIHRLGPYTAIGPVGLELIVETRNAEHASHVLATVRAAGYDVEVVTPDREA